MILNFLKNFLFSIIAICSIMPSFSQEASVSISPQKLAIGNNLKITLTIENNQIKNYGQFPEIPGFRKSGISSSSSTNFINGKMSSSQSITQNYIAVEIGVFQIPGFSIQINEETIKVNGRQVEVDNSYNEPKQSPFNNFFDPFSDPFDDFFDRNNEEFYEVEADAFLNLSTDKKSVYVGEGFNTTLSFYVSESNVADMRFYELGKQLTEIIKKIKPVNCWEENFNIENINSIPVTINNKRYNQYKIFEATYYPLNNNPIKFSKLELELIKYKISKRPSFFGRNKIEDFETFYSKPLYIDVKDLPDHPLKEIISVGNFKLREKINSKNLYTGDDLNYEFEILGEGNISAINEPNINLKGIEFYTPNSQQNIRREKSKVYGSKKFNFYGTPTEPGNYDFSKKINWVFFDPIKSRYDTLKSDIILNVKGERLIKNSNISEDYDPYFNLIREENNTLVSNKKQGAISIILNIITLTLIVMFSFLVLRKGS
ncbi:MAG: BatD family protein [Flammeovirgaceae bacterium]